VQARRVAGGGRKPPPFRGSRYLIPRSILQPRNRAGHQKGGQVLGADWGERGFPFLKKRGQAFGAGLVSLWFQVPGCECGTHAQGGRLSPPTLRLTRPRCQAKWQASRGTRHRMRLARLSTWLATRQIAEQIHRIGLVRTCCPFLLGDVLTLHGAGPLVKSLFGADFRGADSECLGDIRSSGLVSAFSARSRLSAVLVPVKGLHA
jgi:hypothetical protein